MGEAKRRGTFEVRLQEGVEKARQAEIERVERRRLAQERWNSYLAKNIKAQAGLAIAAAILCKNQEETQNAS